MRSAQQLSRARTRADNAFMAQQIIDLQRPRRADPAGRRALADRDSSELRSAADGLRSHLKRSYSGRR